MIWPESYEKANYPATFLGKSYQEVLLVCQ